jgi:hypothetical protein
MTILKKHQLCEITTESIEKCPICESVKHRNWCDGYDRLHRLSSQYFIYHRCDSCGLVFLSLRPKEEDIFKFYPEEYKPYQMGCNPNSFQNRPLEGQEAGQKRIVKSVSFYSKLGARLIHLINRKVDYWFPYKTPAIVQNFYKPPSPGLTLLDFGCGSSSFLNQARKNGWQTLGADFSPGVVDKVITDGHEAFLVNSQDWKSVKTQSIVYHRGYATFSVAIFGEEGAKEKARRASRSMH